MCAGELKHQCEELSSRFELETRLYKEEREQAIRTIRDLNTTIIQVDITEEREQTFRLL
jgi:hypothetical protein